MDVRHLAQNREQVRLGFVVAVFPRGNPAIVEAAEVADVAQAREGEAPVVVRPRERGRLEAVRTARALRGQARAEYGEEQQRSDALSVERWSAHVFDLRICHRPSEGLARKERAKS